MFSEPDNEQRAGWAQTAVDAFQAVCRTDDDSALGDLMANLLHLARAQGLDPERVIDTARMHFEAEEAEEAQEAETESEGA